MTIEHKEAIHSPANGRHRDVVPMPLPDRDVRRKRPPLLMFLLRKETLRRVTRVTSLLAIDFVGVGAAIWTAIAVKLALRGEFTVAASWGNTRAALAFAYLLTVLMFARVDLYADRPRRPGLPRIVTALFQATVIALVFALATGNHFHSYYIFYGALFFGTVYITALRELYTRITGWLLEQAGFCKGYAMGKAGISTRHTLALINRGGATAAEVIALRDRIIETVAARFGIRLEPEPVWVG